jgi:hypothetical protein
LKTLGSDFLVVPKFRKAYFKTNHYAKISGSESEEIWQNRLPHTKINKKDLASSQQTQALEEKMLSTGANIFTPT